MDTEWSTVMDAQWSTVMDAQWSIAMDALWSTVMRIDNHQYLIVSRDGLYIFCLRQRDTWNCPDVHYSYWIKQAWSWECRHCQVWLLNHPKVRDFFIWLFTVHYPKSGYFEVGEPSWSWATPFGDSLYKEHGRRKHLLFALGRPALSFAYLTLEPASLVMHNKPAETSIWILRFPLGDRHC